MKALNAGHSQFEHPNLLRECATAPEAGNAKDVPENSPCLHRSWHTLLPKRYPDHSNRGQNHQISIPSEGTLHFAGSQNT